MSTGQHHSLKILSMSSSELDTLLADTYENNPLLSKVERTAREDGDWADPLEIVAAGPADGTEDLLLQLHTLGWPARDEQVGEYLIGSLNSRGYLEEGWQDATEVFSLTEEKLDRLVGLLQERMEPAGIFARDLTECLLLQLDRLPGDHALSRTILEDHLETLAAGDLSRLAMALEVPESAVEEAVGLLRSLNPIPRNGEPDRVPVRYRIPEVEVIREGEELTVQLLTNGPTYQMNPYYMEARKSGGLSAGERRQMRAFYDEARQLLSAVSQRQKTLLRVMEYLVEIQREFFLHGQPRSGLTEADVAAALSVSVSTVSRAVREKYYRYEGETVALATLFSTRLTSGISSDEIKFLISSLIAMESRERPLTDTAIARYCTVNGHPVARRTITKYRMELGIAPADRRRTPA